MKPIFLSMILLNAGVFYIFSAQLETKVTTTPIAQKAKVVTTITPPITTKTTTTILAPTLPHQVPIQTLEEKITTTPVAVISKQPVSTMETTTVPAPTSPASTPPLPIPTPEKTTTAPTIPARQPAAIVAPSTPISTSTVPLVTPVVERKIAITPMPSAKQPISNVPEKKVSPKIQVEQKKVEKKEPSKKILKQEERKKEPVTKIEAVKPERLDTIDIEEGGNWLIKRQIFEDTFKLIDQMDQLNTKIRDMRMIFYKSRNDIDKQVAIFIKDIGYSLGKLDQMATMILTMMERERKLVGDLSDEERSILASSENIEEEVKQIQNAVQEIMDLDNKIDVEILKSLEDRINESAGYRQQGWKNLQSIKQMLNDEKAQNLFNKTKALYETMQTVLSWLQNQLLPYFNQTIQTVSDDMNTIKQKIDELQSKGINLQEETAKIELQEEEINKQRVEEEIKDTVEKSLEQTKANNQEKKDFFSQVRAILWYPVQLIQNAYTWIVSFFSNTSVSQDKNE